MRPHSRARGPAPRAAAELVHEHRELHDALLARDAARARRVVIDQIEASRARVMAGLLTGANAAGRAASGIALTDRTAAVPTPNPPM